MHQPGSRLMRIQGASFSILLNGMNDWRGWPSCGKHSSTNSSDPQFPPSRPAKCPFWLRQPTGEHYPGAGISAVANVDLRASIGIDLPGRQVLPGAEFGIRTPGRRDCSRFISTPYVESERHGGTTCHFRG